MTKINAICTLQLLSLLYMRIICIWLSRFVIPARYWLKKCFTKRAAQGRRLHKVNVFVAFLTDVTTLLSCSFYFLSSLFLKRREKIGDARRELNAMIAGCPGRSRIWNTAKETAERMDPWCHVLQVVVGPIAEPACGLWLGLRLCRHQCLPV